MQGRLLRLCLLGRAGRRGGFGGGFGFGISLGLGGLLQLLQLLRRNHLQVLQQVAYQALTQLNGLLRGFLLGAAEVALVLGEDALYFLLVLQQQEVIGTANFVVEGVGQLDFRAAARAGVAGAAALAVFAVRIRW